MLDQIIGALLVGVAVGFLLGVALVLSDRPTEQNLTRDHHQQ